MAATCEAAIGQKRDPNGGGSAARSRSRSSSSTAIHWIPLRCTVFHRTGVARLSCAITDRTSVL